MSICPNYRIKNTQLFLHIRKLLIIGVKIGGKFVAGTIILTHF
nr:MAG TPA: hypothetical protein [Bacteriophage sp.]